MNTSEKFIISPLISRALEFGEPVIALESAVITHGLPYPDNTSVAKSIESEVKHQNAHPATIFLLDGKVRIGIEENELDHIGTHPDRMKIGARDLSTAIAMGWSGGTTVSSTILIANKVGIRIFATGAIGGVHRGSRFDISSDLQMLSQVPVIVVCSGAKNILDLPATVEYLETVNVPVLGYQTNKFPSFLSGKSDLPVSVRVSSIEDICQIAISHWEMGFKSALLVVVPVPEEFSMSDSEFEFYLLEATKNADQSGIKGKEITPYLLDSIHKQSDGKSLLANKELLINNARIAAKIGVALAG